MGNVEAHRAARRLDAFEWHDLSVTSIAVTERGFELSVAPWVEELACERLCCLRVSDAEVLSLDLGGALSLRELRALEVSSFVYTLAPTGRLTGTLRILPGGAGLWTISFADARWSLEDAPAADGTDGTMIAARRHGR